MKKLFLLILISFFIFSCVIKEPAFPYDYSLNNDNASLYILNHSDKDLCVQLQKTDVALEEIILKPVKNEALVHNSIYNAIKNERYAFISYSKIKHSKSDYEDTEYKSFPYSLDDCNLICSDFGNTNIVKLVIKTEDEILFSSNLEVPQTEPAVTFVHYTLGGYSFENIDKNFNNGDFFFTNRIGNYFFVDFDTVDFSDLKNLVLDNPRYIIVIGEILGENKWQ